ncbi:hypothetical protein E2C01_047886 [Portunus trituberculatus]|uniref:Uncharacterized protein n=1 Tax=Portunus trituberculatus TaxID=210409 RepID=A0A5B7G285_PORTR|nr:hypothetical protein [Portunus trituberculatus]
MCWQGFPNTTQKWEGEGDRRIGKGNVHVGKEKQGDVDELLRADSKRGLFARPRPEKGKCVGVEIFPGGSGSGGRPRVQVKGAAY